MTQARFVDKLVAVVPEVTETVRGPLDDQEGELLVHLPTADLIGLNPMATKYRALSRTQAMRHALPLGI